MVTERVQASWSFQSPGPQTVAAQRGQGQNGGSTGRMVRAGMEEALRALSDVPHVL